MAGTGTSTSLHHSQSHIQTLARQGSLYNLTLNEVQSHLAEPLLSMNLDDLMKSIFPDEPPQPVPVAIQNSNTGTSLQRQGSLSMPPSLSKKTIDEVWKGINQTNHSPTTGDDQLGEMTLESFLLKAGVLLDEGKDVISPNFTGNNNGIVTVAAQPANWMQPCVNPISWMGPGTVIDAEMRGGSGYGSGSGDGDGGGVDKVVERRQKRMIKNRESAARSRARKQAYTNELENKVSRLEEENERLKKQKVIDNMLCSVPVQAPKYQLRRTSSASF
ncbi:hypothetical protein LUZ60_010953 [Juncus effusus]|nr:hypothetical protein LUZ60_010953 [Juncus effusus]